MTTIATDGKAMAADSLTSASGDRVQYGPKVHRAANGEIFACAGIRTSGIKFRRFMLEGGEWPDLDDDFAALILTPAGECFWIDNTNERCLVMTPAAIGSGDCFAIGAMLAGADPERAVAISIERDTRSGGTITVMRL
jgi:hypothetical protein